MTGIRNIFLLLGTRNIGCLDANKVSLENCKKKSSRRNLKLEDDIYVSRYLFCKANGKLIK
ncbi:hypothetical protein OUZ56_007041 [Daphnia magna]|uniref:Uncharacterized protein n=1 Tax=Daphnia magna TaxID=35525 RepID=A0ABQ9YXE5_9CRUS|nr:hypothetical protein OUZ56_007041 [Daphnia magna]